MFMWFGLISLSLDNFRWSLWINITKLSIITGSIRIQAKWSLYFSLFNKKLKYLQMHLEVLVDLSWLLNLMQLFIAILAVNIAQLLQSLIYEVYLCHSMSFTVNWLYICTSQDLVCAQVFGNYGIVESRINN